MHLINGCHTRIILVVTKYLTAVGNYTQIILTTAG